MPQSRRKLDYSACDDVSFAIKDLKSADSEFPQDLLRPAARRWAQGAGWTLGSYSQPIRCPAAEPTFSCTARCFEHEFCHANQGSVFRFEGHIEKKHFYRLLVQKAGDCNGEVRKYRESASSSKELAVSTEDRRRIHAAADSLLQDYMQATPTAVIQRMGDPPVDAAHVRSVLRWRREQYGNCTAGFRASESDFTEEAERWADVDSKPIHLARWTLNLFCWAAVLTPFMLELVRLKQSGRLDGIYLAADWTFKVDVMNYSMGLIACVVRRKLQKNWRATPWPLVAVLTATEELAGYRLGFDVLCDALKHYDLPNPVAVSTDFFSGSGEAATSKWPRCAHVQDLWHLRRNLIKNDNAARRQLQRSSEGLGSVPGTPARKSKRQIRAKAKPKAKGKAKLPPHLKKRFVWAFLKLVDYLAWCPTRAFFHCVAQTIFKRVEFVWQEKEFLQYFVQRYMIRVPASDSSIDGTEHFWGATWWVGIGRYARLPPSQQPSESLNAIVKRQLRAQGPVTTHVDLVHKFAKAVQTLSTPMLFGADRSKKPVTLMGRDVRSGKPTTPSEWMWQKGKSVRRPFDK
ncbi:unnamed protein product [Symbiodinium sp. CCMP2592]|nr:unnamed protein product [Symbiodinium sp. CCMP2592]